MSFDLAVQNGDLVLGNNGDFITVVDSPKCIQDMIKICITPAGGDPSFPWYGSFVSRALVGSVLAQNITLQMGQSQLQNALQILMQLQAAQTKSGQMVSADEQINSILGISITRDMTNPTFYNVQVKALTKGFKPITASFDVANVSYNY